jgi:hypothetical protein
VLQDLKLTGYGYSYHRGTIGNSTLAQDDNEHQLPSLWEHVEFSTSLQNLHVSVRGSDKGNEHVDSVQAKARSGLPQLRDAVHRKTSLTSLAVHLYCRICAQQENENQAMTFQRQEALSTMIALSESLNNHQSIRKLELQYRSDANPRTLLVPYVTDILVRSNLSELKLECLSFPLSIDRIGFPANEFVNALKQSKEQKLEVLRLCDVGLTDHQATDFLRNLPNHIKTLDLTNNPIVTFPAPKSNHNSSKLREFNLEKCLCLYNHNQETSLEPLLNLLLNYPCLNDFGPRDKWQFKPPRNPGRYMETQDSEETPEDNRYSILMNLMDQTLVNRSFPIERYVGKIHSFTSGKDGSWQCLFVVLEKENSVCVSVVSFSLLCLTMRVTLRNSFRPCPWFGNT